MSFFYFDFKIVGLEKDVPNVVRQKKSSGLFLGRGLPSPTRGAKIKAILLLVSFFYIRLTDEREERRLLTATKSSAASGRKSEIEEVQ